MNPLEQTKDILAVRENLHIYRLNHQMSQSDFKSFCSILARFKMTKDEAWQEVLLRKHLISEMKLSRSKELEEIFGRNKEQL